MNTFYTLPKHVSEQFVGDAVLESSHVVIEELCCKKSACRKITDMSFRDAYIGSIKNNKTKWTFVRRQSDASMEFHKDYFELVCDFPLTDDTDIFIWITIAAKNGEKFIKQYKLKENK